MTLKPALFLVALMLTLSSCGVYSFTGASITPDTKTVAIAVFENNARLVLPNLSQKLTEGLKTQVINGTSLSYVRDPAQADCVFEGAITEYVVQPIAITGGLGQNAQTTAQQSRLTITVNVKFTNIKNDKNNFDQNFSRYADFDNARQSLQQVEQTLIDQIDTQLIQDIFNKAFVNW